MSRSRDMQATLIGHAVRKTHKTALTAAFGFGIGRASLRWSDTPEGWPSG